MLEATGQVGFPCSRQLVRLGVSVRGNWSGCQCSQCSRQLVSFSVWVWCQCSRQGLVRFRLCVSVIGNWSGCSRWSGVSVLGNWSGWVLWSGVSVLGNWSGWVSVLEATGQVGCQCYRQLVRLGVSVTGQATGQVGCQCYRQLVRLGVSVLGNWSGWV